MTDPTLAGAIKAHREGKSELARLLYGRAIAARPGSAEAHRWYGRFEFEQGDFPEALRLLRKAASLAPQEPAVHADLSRALAAAGRPDQAAAVLESLLRHGGENPALRFNLALLRLGNNEANRATAELEQVLAADPRHVGALQHLARLRAANGRSAEAETLLGRAAAAAPDDPAPLLALGGLLGERGEHGKAIGLFQRAIATGRLQRPEGHIRLSRALEADGDAQAALQTAIEGTEAFPGDDIAWRHLGDLHKRRGELSAACRAFDRAHGILRDPDSGYGAGRSEICHTNRAKLQHDIDQLAYLRDRGVEGMEALLGEHLRLTAKLPHSLADGDVVSLPPSLIREVGGHYNRCMRRVAAPELDGGALNPNLDPASIAADYERRAPGITWIDDFLRPAAVASLRRYLLESTIWYDSDHPNGYVGAYLHDGFTCPLVMQIARELPALLPRIFGHRPLLQLWAYHYDSRLAGIGMHADFAAVNVNFWLTPTEAMVERNSGGMVIWNKKAPKDWSYHDYNKTDPATKARIDDFLAREGAAPIRIHHRQNRVVIFNSDLFHRTDDIRFRAGFENRRINVTMLYGHREQ